MTDGPTDVGNEYHEKALLATFAFLSTSYSLKYQALQGYPSCSLQPCGSWLGLGGYVEEILYRHT